MTVLVIDKKRYVLIPEKSYQDLQKKAAMKTKPENVLPIELAKAHSKKLLRKIAYEK